ncbi:MAG: hypothetical protein AB1896_17415 [Thermodesulfobacteriota bacterium]
MTLLFLGMWAGPAAGGEMVYPGLSVSVVDAKSFKPIEYANISIECGGGGVQCNNPEGCTGDLDWVNPQYGWYRAITGHLYLPKIGQGQQGVLAHTPEAAPTYEQTVCLRIWKSGYKPQVVETTIRPGQNTVEVFLAPLSEAEMKKSAEEAEQPAGPTEAAAPDLEDKGKTEEGGETSGPRPGGPPW